ncbi:MAG: RIP metalloprotease RseP [Gemmatimonadota bacterium]
MTIIATIIVLGVLIFVHELGHFLAARSVGIRVERFSIGLGPRIWGFTRGDTEYVLSIIPLGGYVKMGGMEDEMMEAIEGGKDDSESASEVSRKEAIGWSAESSRSSPATTEQGRDTEAMAGRSGDFDSKPVWARAWVISAGVVMNFLFAFVAYTVVAAGWGSFEQDTTRVGAVNAETLPAGASALAEIPTGAELVRIGGSPVEHWGEVRAAILAAPDGPIAFEFDNPPGEVTVELTGDEARQRTARSIGYWLGPVIEAVSPGEPADRAGLQAGDRIVEVEGRAVESWSDLQESVVANPEREIRITIERDGGRLVRPVTPERAELQDPVTGELEPGGRIGVLPVLHDVAYTRVPPLEALQAGWNQTVGVTGLIVGFLRDLVTGQVSTRNLGSIVAIGEMSGQAAAEGLPVFLRFMALFSVNLAVLNLLPIPVLDGGHLVFLGIEAVRGRPLSVEQRLRWSQLGFIVLVGIMALALGNDVLRLFGL